MREVRSRHRTGSIWVTPGGSPWATIDKKTPKTPPRELAVAYRRLKEVRSEDEGEQ